MNGIIELEYCEEFDEYVLPLSDELLAGAGLKLGDTVEWIDNHDGTWTLRKKQMSKFTLTCEYEDRTTTVSFEAETHDQVVSNMNDFLRGCGFYYEGYLDIVPDEFAPTYSLNAEWPFPEEGEEETDATDHSEFFYDTTRNK